jgi:hypothetical protein
VSCTTCNKDNPADALFCQGCGGRLESKKMKTTKKIAAKAPRKATNSRRGARALLNKGSGLGELNPGDASDSAACSDSTKTEAAKASEYGQ